MAVGIICEYNPFHNGHLHHLKEVKRLYPLEEIVLIMSGNFTERGDVSLINKWDKTDIAINYGVNLVVELPFCYATESADNFAYGSIRLLNHLKVNTLVFGSECNDVSLLTKLANIQLTEDYNLLVKKYVDEGINYPTALSMSLKQLTNTTITTPNDILGISYIREIIKLKSNIKPITIKRTNDFHDIDSDVASATSIRNSLLENKDVSKVVPKYTLKYLNNYNFIDNYFDLIKYKIISSEDLSIYHNVDIDLASRIKSNIFKSNCLEELILNVKTKRYTYNRIKRCLLMILCNYTKEEAIINKSYDYIRILGFDNIGKTYLNKLKKELNVPLIVNYKKCFDDFLKLETKVTNIYNLYKDTICLETSKPIIR